MSLKAMRAGVCAASRDGHRCLGKLEKWYCHIHAQNYSFSPRLRTHNTYKIYDGVRRKNTNCKLHIPFSVNADWQLAVHTQSVAKGSKTTAAAAAGKGQGSGGPQVVQRGSKWWSYGGKQGRQNRRWLSQAVQSGPSQRSQKLPVGKPQRLHGGICGRPLSCWHCQMNCVKATGLTAR